MKAPPPEDGQPTTGLPSRPSATDGGAAFPPGPRPIPVAEPSSSSQAAPFQRSSSASPVGPYQTTVIRSIASTASWGANDDSPVAPEPDAEPSSSSHTVP